MGQVLPEANKGQKPSSESLPCLPMCSWHPKLQLFQASVPGLASDELDLV